MGEAKRRKDAGTYPARTKIKPKRAPEEVRVLSSRVFTVNGYNFTELADGTMYEMTRRGFRRVPPADANVVRLYHEAQKKAAAA